METRPAHKRVWRSRRSGSSAQDGEVRLTRLRSFHESAARRETRSASKKTRVRHATLTLKIVGAIAMDRRRLSRQSGPPAPAPGERNAPSPATTQIEHSVAF